VGGEAAGACFEPVVVGLAEAAVGVLVEAAVSARAVTAVL
jgi:hypothetical protein